jgi:putative DNA primase/helicase
MARIEAGDRAGAEVLMADVVAELTGTPDVGKVEWWFRQEIGRAWPKEAEPEPVEEEQASVEGWSLPLFASLEQDRDANPPMLSPDAPMDNAKAFTQRRCYRGKAPVAWFWNDGTKEETTFWRWNGRVYAKVSEGELRAEVGEFLDRAMRWAVVDKKAVPTRFQPKPTHSEALIYSLKQGLRLKDNAVPPMWLSSGERAGSLMAFRNAIVDLRTGEAMVPTPDLWIHDAVDIDWIPGAECPTWLRFLEQLHPGDREAQDFVEEFGGLAMTEDIRFQKGALLVGRPRSGKSTILKVWSWATGSAAYVSLSYNNWLAGENSCQPLIGKRLAGFADVRLKPPKRYGQNEDPGGLDHGSRELSLKLTGGDEVSFGRKYTTAWKGIWGGKLAHVSNEVPNYNDPVLVTRFIKLWFGQSFLDREDIHIPEKLRAEMPGIVQRFVRAYQRLCVRGCFLQPRSGRRLDGEVRAQSATLIEKFFAEWLVIDPAATVHISVVMLKLQEWARATGNLALLTKIPDSTKLTGQLKTIPGLDKLERTGKPKQYVGLRLKREEERE